MSADRMYMYDAEKLGAIKTEAAWMHNPKHFTHVKISPSAVVKMMTHSQSGVEKGIKQSGKPTEVMGLLFGHPDLDDMHCLVISDAAPIPAEGFETRVVMDDQNVINYMISLSDVNEETRHYTYCGWYHTHPFDLDVNSHCYLSSTDIQTQRLWQNAEDPHGNPWVAIVIDPLRSAAKGRPELMAFRTYPPDHETRPNEMPSGLIAPDENTAVSKWGVGWKSYYALEVSYFMSSLAMNALNVLKNKFLWMNSFTDAPELETEHQQQVEDGLRDVTSRLSAHSTKGNTGPFRHNSSYLSADESHRLAGPSASVTPGRAGGASEKEGELKQAAQAGTRVALDGCQCHMSALVRNMLFGNGGRMIHRGEVKAEPMVGLCREGATDMES